MFNQTCLRSNDILRESMSVPERLKDDILSRSETSFSINSRPKQSKLPMERKNDFKIQISFLTNENEVRCRAVNSSRGSHITKSFPTQIEDETSSQNNLQCGQDELKLSGSKCEREILNSKDEVTLLESNNELKPFDSKCEVELSDSKDDLELSGLSVKLESPQTDGASMAACCTSLQCSNLSIPSTGRTHSPGLN